MPIILTQSGPGRFSEELQHLNRESIYATTAYVCPLERHHCVQPPAPDGKEPLFYK